jgi:hypothetical protein
MSKRFASGLFTLAMLTVPALAAPAVPQFNARPGCQAGADSGLSAKPNVDQCVQSEMKARDEIVRQWAEFHAEDKTRCVDSTQRGGPPSYIEVLTCLEIGRDARRISKENTGLDARPGRRR